MKQKKNTQDKTKLCQNFMNHPAGIKIKKSCLKRLPKREEPQIDVSNIDMLDGEMEAIYVRKFSAKQLLYNFMNQVQ